MLNFSEYDHLKFYIDMVLKHAFISTDCILTLKIVVALERVIAHSSCACSFVFINDA